MLNLPQSIVQRPKDAFALELSYVCMPFNFLLGANTFCDLNNQIFIHFHQNFFSFIYSTARRYFLFLFSYQKLFLVGTLIDICSGKPDCSKTFFREIRKF